MSHNIPAQALVYKNEPALSVITLIFGLLFWLLLIVGTFGFALFYVFIGFIFYLFVQSGLIAWIKGTAVKLTPEQFSELNGQYLYCCERLGIKDRPECYIVNGGGMLNAFATRFMGRNFVVLLSDVVDALQDKPDGINFYFGHELGHIRMKHLTGHIWRAPALWMPLLGAAYSRAQEYTCDLHGRACCESPETAAQALVVLASGEQLWKTTNLAAYAGQAKGTSAFWPSFHEITGPYPWLTKRVAYALNSNYTPPCRNPLAYFFALSVPNAGRMAGGAGGLVGLLMVFMLIGVLAAAAIPAYQDDVKRADVAKSWTETAHVRSTLTQFYQNAGYAPDTLEEVELPVELPDGKRLWLDSDSMAVSVYDKLDAELLLVPEFSEDGSGSIKWSCVAGEGLRESYLPKSCK